MKTVADYVHQKGLKFGICAPHPMSKSEIHLMSKRAAAADSVGSIGISSGSSSGSGSCSGGSDSGSGSGSCCSPAAHG